MYQCRLINCKCATAVQDVDSVGKYMETMYFPLRYAMNPKLLFKKIIKKINLGSR